MSIRQNSMSPFDISHLTMTRSRLKIALDHKTNDFTSYEIPSALFQIYKVTKHFTNKAITTIKPEYNLSLIQC